MRFPVPDWQCPRYAIDRVSAIGNYFILHRKPDARRLPLDALAFLEPVLLDPRTFIARRGMPYSEDAITARRYHGFVREMTDIAALLRGAGAFDASDPDLIDRLPAPLARRVPWASGPDTLAGKLKVLAGRWWSDPGPKRGRICPACGAPFYAARDAGFCSATCRKRERAAQRIP